MNACGEMILLPLVLLFWLRGGRRLLVLLIGSHAILDTVPAITTI